MATRLVVGFFHKDRSSLRRIYDSSSIGDNDDELRRWKAAWWLVLLPIHRIPPDVPQVANNDADPAAAFRILLLLVPRC